MSTPIDHFHQSLVHLHQPPMSSFSPKNGHGRSLWRQIIESTRDIYKSHFRHFHAISILFLLPIVFSFIVYPSFHLAIFHPDYDFTSFAQLQFSNIEIIVLIVYTLFLALFFICGVGTTTYSAVNAFYDRPINLVSSIKSIRNSFFPLLSTFIVSQTIFISIAIVFVLLLVFVVRILQSLGLKYDSNHLLFLVIFGLIVLVPVLIWLQVNWSLAYVIAVVESKRGYETLRRSANLVKGKRWIAFGILMYYGFVIVLMVVGCAMFLVSVGAAKGDQWRSLDVILQTAVVSVFGYILMNQYLVANMVLYMYCKDLNNDEKLALETGSEYVSLPLDEEKNHVISVGRSRWRDIIESTRNIFNSHAGHFHAISILFLLPIVFSLIVYPSFHLAIFHPDCDFTSFPQLQFSNIEIVVLIVYTLFLALFFICGVGTITSSAVNAFYNRPVNLVSSIKSIRNSFFPLLSTLIVSQTIFISIAFIFSLILVFVVQFLQSLRLIELKYDSNHLSFLVIFGLIVLVPFLIWLQVNWSLAYVIAVVESKKGYKALRRSANLVKGKRWIAFGILMYYGLIIVLMVVSDAMFLVSVGAAKGDQWRSLAVILQTALGSVLGYILMNQYLVANMVLYMYCKDLNNDEKLVLKTGNEYVSLPLDEEKNHDIV